jgi:hypothetical protein
LISSEGDAAVGRAAASRTRPSGGLEPRQNPFKIQNSTAETFARAGVAGFGFRGSTTFKRSRCSRSEDHTLSFSAGRERREGARAVSQAPKIPQPKFPTLGADGGRGTWTSAPSVAVSSRGHRAPRSRRTRERAARCRIPAPSPALRGTPPV